MPKADLINQNKAAEEEFKKELMAYRQHILDVAGKVPDQPKSVYGSMLNQKPIENAMIEETKGSPQLGLWKALAASSKK